MKLFHSSTAPTSRASPSSAIRTTPSPLTEDPQSSATRPSPTPQVRPSQLSQQPPFQAPRHQPSQSQSQPQPQHQVALSVQHRASHSQPRASHSQPQHLEAPLSQQQESPHSSQAQNSHATEYEEDLSDAKGPDDYLVEPDLSEDQLAALNALLARPRTNMTVLDPELPPETTWFGYDHSSLTWQITRIFTNKFDGPYHNWSCVPRERRERYFVEFAKKHTWDPSLTGLVQEHFESIIQLRLKGMVSTARTSGEQPKWIKDTLWA